MRLSHAARCGALGQRNEVKAGMAPVPQHRVHGPVERERINDEIRLARWGEALQSVQKVQPGGGIARAGSLDADCAEAMRQRAKRPAGALALIAGMKMGTMGVIAPTGAGIALGRDWTEFIKADHRAPRWWSGGEPDNGPLFSANSGSSLSSQVRGFCHLICSALSMRRIWLRLLGTPLLASSPCSRSNVQWQVGGRCPSGPSSGLGGSPRARAITRL